MRPALFAIVVLAVFAMALAGPAPRLTYKDVKPILDKKCGACHSGPSPKEGLILVTYEGIIKGNREGKVVIPRKPAQSKLIKLVSGKAMPKMPPGPAGLSKAEIKKLTDWVQAGARK